MKAAVATSDGDMLRVGIPQTLFDLTTSVAAGSVGSHGRSTNWGPKYDVSPDGTRFLRIMEVNPPIREIAIVQNWFEEVKRLAPVP